jgi:hypothetical protein
MSNSGTSTLWDWGGLGSAITVEVIGGIIEILIIVSFIEYLRDLREIRKNKPIIQQAKKIGKDVINDALSSVAPLANQINGNPFYHYKCGSVDRALTDLDEIISQVRAASAKMQGNFNFFSFDESMKNVFINTNNQLSQLETKLKTMRFSFGQKLNATSIENKIVDIENLYCELSRIQDELKSSS